MRALVPSLVRELRSYRLYHRGQKIILRQLKEYLYYIERKGKHVDKEKKSLEN